MPRIKWSADLPKEYDVPRFNRNVRILRKKFPCKHRVVVRLIDGADIRDESGTSCHAITIQHPRSFEIQIGRVEDISMCIRWLIEEWSHCLEPPNRKTHHNRYRDIHHKILYTLLGD